MLTAGIDWPFSRHVSAAPRATRFLYGLTVLCDMHARLVKDRNPKSFEVGALVPDLTSKLVIMSDYVCDRATMLEECDSRVSYHWRTCTFLTPSATLAVAPADALTRSRTYSRHQEPAASAAGLPERAAAGCVGADAGVSVDVHDVLDVRFGTVVHRLAPDLPP